MKMDRQRGAQKDQEVFYDGEAWAHEEEEEEEEHADASYEDDVAPRSEPAALSSGDFSSSTERAGDQRSELRAEMSVTRSSKRKETTKHKKTIETIVVVQEADRDRELPAPQDRTTRETRGDQVFIRTLESPGEVPDLPVRQLQEQKVTEVTKVTETAETSMHTESRERQEGRRTTTVKEIESETTEPVTLSRKVSYQESVQVISGKREEEDSRAEKITVQQTEVTATDKAALVTRVRRVEEKKSRREETVVQPAPEKQEKFKSVEVIKKATAQEEVTLRGAAEESVTDIRPQRPGGIRQTESDFKVETKKKEFKDEETSLLKGGAVEKRRLSPPAASRGTERDANLLIMPSLTLSLFLFDDHQGAAFHQHFHVLCFTILHHSLF